MYCQTLVYTVLSGVNHPPNCSTQQFLKVMTACKKACAALVASCAPPIKSSRKKAMTFSSSLIFHCHHVSISNLLRLRWYPSHGQRAIAIPQLLHFQLSISIAC